LEVSIAAFKVSEWEMSRQPVSNRRMWLWQIPYGTYVDLVLVTAKADAVFRMRVTAIFVGAKVRIGDHIVTWQRPDVLSRWLQNEFQALGHRACPRSSSVDSTIC